MLYYINSAIYLANLAMLSICLIDSKFSSNPIIETKKEMAFCFAAWCGYLLAVLERFS